MSIKKDDILVFDGDYYLTYCNKNKSEFYIYSVQYTDKELMTVVKTKDGYKSSFDIDIMMEDLGDYSNFQKTTELYASLEFIKVTINYNNEEKDASEKVEQFNDWGDVTLKWVEKNEGINSKRKDGNYLIVTTNNNKKYLFLNNLSTEIKRDDNNHYCFEYHGVKASSMGSMKEVIKAFYDILKDMYYDIIKDSLAEQGLIDEWMIKENKGC